MNDRREIISFLSENDGFLIATHVNPEGDALGSAIALAMALESMGKKAWVFEKDPIPDFYGFLPGSERVLHSLDSLKPSSLCLVLVDCNTPMRAGLQGGAFRRSAVIDHHETEGRFGEAKWIDPKAPATGLMIYDLVREMGVEITRDMAVNLYTAIAVDTGTFRYRNATPAAMRAAADLAERGADPGAISEKLYESWSEARFRLLCMTLGTLEIRDGMAMITVTREMLKRTGTTALDTENFTGFPRLIRDASLSAFFREDEDGAWKVSMRSKGQLNVARIAEAFGGGGHKNAAGYTISGDLASAKERLFAEVEKQRAEAAQGKA
ncbi:MAG: bifunctional oligoribonuclease/PAP phosphatase NrnA [Thermodesulfovibrionales bacterium]